MILFSCMIPLADWFRRLLQDIVDLRVDLAEGSGPLLLPIFTSNKTKTTDLIGRDLYRAKIIDLWLSRSWTTLQMIWWGVWAITMIEILAHIRFLRNQGVAEWEILAWMLTVASGQSGSEVSGEQPAISIFNPDYISCSLIFIDNEILHCLKKIVLSTEIGETKIRRGTCIWENLSLSLPNIAACV